MKPTVLPRTQAPTGQLEECKSKLQEEHMWMFVLPNKQDCIYRSPHALLAIPAVSKILGA